MDYDLDGAACAGQDPAVFANLNFVEKAREICASCPVLDACREATLQTEMRWGVKSRACVYAGLTPVERFAIDKERWGHLPLGKPIDAELRKALAS